MQDKLKDIELVVFDLDGTLLSNEGTIGTRTKELVKELQSKGVQFSFASGRLYSAIELYAKELELKAPLVTLDGSYIKGIDNEKIVYESFIKKKYVQKVIDYADNCLVNVCLCHADAIYFTERNSVIPQLMDKFGAKYQETETYDEYLDRTLEIVLAGDNRESIKFIENKMDIPYAFGLNLSFFKSQSHNNIYYLEIRRSGSSKGKGFLRLCRKLKINPKNAVVIGDWYNDISLFQTKAVKVAVSNAVAEIKRYADIILTKSNNEDGTAEMLEKILRAKNN